MIHHERCPLCSSTKVAVRMICCDHFISKEEFGIAECASCGFLFTQDHPDEEASGRYYESAEYISHSDTSEGFVNKVYRIVRLMMLRRKRNIIQRLTGLKKGKLLDIGSGTGHFAAEMKGAGWDVNGIEINEKARDFSSSSFGLEVYSPRKIPSLKKSSYDCITLWHVLEHFQDPHGYMEDIFSLLKPDGTCVVALPNCSSYDCLHYGRYWAAYDVPRHLWHFSPATFGLLAGQHHMIITEQVALPFDVFYISILSEKYKGSFLPALKGGLIGCWFTMKSIVGKNTGSSVIYVLKKKSGLRD